MPSPLRFGIIACSSIARRRFLPALRESTARLERIGSRDPDRGRQYATEFSCAKYGSYEAVLSDADVDAVYISTPPVLHQEWVMKAAAAGKHVLCEKPAFCDIESARRAVEYCRSRGVRVMEAYSFKFHPQHALVRSLVEQGRIGQPRFFSAEFAYPRPPDGDIRLKPELGGGVLHDSAGYPVAATLLQMSARPVSVFCQLGYDCGAGVDNAFSLWLGFAGGEMAQGLVAFDAHYRSRYSVSGTRGRIEVARAFSVAPNAKTTIMLETDALTEDLAVDPADQFALMVDAFCAYVQDLSPREDYGNELLLQQTIMEASARSCRERRVVDLSEYS
jgi:dTDP-3,4-didehydro-2,6-dideoxy-alpha-D-glucose 3-reductase